MLHANYVKQNVAQHIIEDATLILRIYNLQP